MAISTDQVAALAALARISMTAEELQVLAPQLDHILRAVAHVSDVAARSARWAPRQPDRVLLDHRCPGGLAVVIGR